MFSRISGEQIIWGGEIMMATFGNSELQLQEFQLMISRRFISSIARRQPDTCHRRGRPLERPRPPPPKGIDRSGECNGSSPCDFLRKWPLGLFCFR